MKKISTQLKKEVTLESLDKRFDGNDKAISELVATVDSLAVSTARAFDHIETLFIKQANEMSGLGEGVKSVRMNVMDLGDRFVSHHSFNELALRVNKLEKSKK
jgi:hypothetical protein